MPDDTTELRERWSIIESLIVQIVFGIHGTIANTQGRKLRAPVHA